MPAPYETAGAKGIESGYGCKADEEEKIEKNKRGIQKKYIKQNRLLITVSSRVEDITINFQLSYMAQVHP
jgi:hypothetical protein